MSNIAKTYNIKPAPNHLLSQIGLDRTEISGMDDEAIPLLQVSLPEAFVKTKGRPEDNRPCFMQSGFSMWEMLTARYRRVTRSLG